MVINIELLDGATIEHLEVFYTLVVDDARVTVKELFTGLRVGNSELESEIMRCIIKDIEEQTKAD
jgi:hypothetical protein